MVHDKMIQNLVWARGNNIIAIPAVAGALVYSGFFLRRPKLEHLS